METTGRTINIPKLEISDQERAENNSHQKASTQVCVCCARQDW